MFLNKSILNKLFPIFSNTAKTGLSKLFEKRKNVYYYQVFAIYNVIYGVIANFGKQQKVF